MPTTVAEWRLINFSSKKFDVYQRVHEFFLFVQRQIEEIAKHLRVETLVHFTSKTLRTRSARGINHERRLSHAEGNKTATSSGSRGYGKTRPVRWCRAWTSKICSRLAYLWLYSIHGTSLGQDYYNGWRWRSRGQLKGRDSTTSKCFDGWSRYIFHRSGVQNWMWGQKYAFSSDLLTYTEAIVSMMPRPVELWFM